MLTYYACHALIRSGKEWTSSLYRCLPLESVAYWQLFWPSPCGKKKLKLHSTPYWWYLPIKPHTYPICRKSRQPYPAISPDHPLPPSPQQDWDLRTPVVKRKSTTHWKLAARDKTIEWDRAHPVRQKINPFPPLNKNLPSNYNTFGKFDSKKKTGELFGTELGTKKYNENALPESRSEANNSSLSAQI